MDKEETKEFQGITLKENLDQDKHQDKQLWFSEILTVPSARIRQLPY
jgi:hypothetical protein